MLIDTIRQDLTAAMKARDAVKLRTLRAAIAAVQDAEVAGAEARKLTDAEVQKGLTSQVKQRVEAAEAFDQAGRSDRAADERAEQEVLQSYLPAALGGDELVALIEATLAEGGWSSKADMVRAMKAVNAKVDGRADGRTVADLVKARLS
jgi:uncharacterized protein YqeY